MARTEARRKESMGQERGGGVLLGRRSAGEVRPQSENGGRKAEDSAGARRVEKDAPGWVLPECRLSDLGAGETGRRTFREHGKES